MAQGRPNGGIWSRIRSAARDWPYRLSAQMSTYEFPRSAGYQDRKRNRASYGPIMGNLILP